MFSVGHGFLIYFVGTIDLIWLVNISGQKKKKKPTELPYFWHLANGCCVCIKFMVKVKSTTTTDYLGGYDKIAADEEILSYLPHN